MSRKVQAGLSLLTGVVVYSTHLAGSLRWSSPLRIAAW